MQFNPTFWKIAESDKRYIFLQGGSGSGKTYSTLQKEIIIAQKRKKHISLMSESVPHLRMGMIKDFKDILISENNFDRNAWHDTNGIYTFPNGSVAEFFSADNAGKVHGGRRDRLVVNEVIHIHPEIFRQAAMRTKEQITSDFNPKHRFWGHDKYIDNPEYSDTLDFFKSTMYDNKFLSADIIHDNEIQGRQDPNFKKVYIDGEIGSCEGLIYPNFKICQQLPDYYSREFFGLDFGFTVGMTCLTQIRLCEGALYIRELFYSRGLLNRDINDLMEELEIPKDAEIVGDNNAPSTIQELNDVYGWNIQTAIKGKDSVEFGISACKSYPIYVTCDSVNGIKEMRNYSNMTDPKTGEYINKPIKKGDHFCDSFRYPVQTLLTDQPSEEPSVY
jgi:phage terminase large subunit